VNTCRIIRRGRTGGKQVGHQAKVGWHGWSAVALLAGPALMIGSGSRADTINWQGTTGNWSTASNWLDTNNQSNRVPGSSDNAYIDNGGTAQIAGGSAAASNLYVGYSGCGNLAVTNGGVLSDTLGCVGNNTGSTGVVTVDGVGSQANLYYVGYSGNGTVHITNGGRLNGPCPIGYNPSSIGVITVDGVDGVCSWWNGGPNAVVGYSGSGTLAITNGALASSGAWIIGRNAGSTGSVTVDGTCSTLNAGTSFVVGELGNGTLSVTNGGLVAGTGSTTNIATGLTGTKGVVTVNGNGSSWTNAGTIDSGVPNRATGILNITDGGLVSSAGYLAVGLTDVVNVDGIGSKWTNTGSLTITGTASITNSGAVTATGVLVYNSSLLAMDVGHGSLLTVGGGSGTITNNGTVRISAAPNTAAGTYQPILAGSWTGNGTVQALGGAWNSANDTFTVQAPQAGTPGSPVTINQRTTQSVTVNDTTTGWAVAASFGATTTDSSLTITATAVAGQALSSLQSLLNTSVGAAVLNGWTFTPGAGYTQGEPAYLSLDVGPGFNVSELNVWHYDGSVWTAYTPTDLTYDGTYANFTVTGFSGYAVSSVPEPTSLALLAMGGLPLLRRRKRKMTR